MQGGAVPGNSHNMFSVPMQSVFRVNKWAPQVDAEQHAKKYPVVQHTMPRFEVPAALRSASVGGEHVAEQTSASSSSDNVFAQTPFAFGDFGAPRPRPRANASSRAFPIFSHAAKQRSAVRSPRSFHSYENKKQKERSSLAEFTHDRAKHNFSFDLEAPNVSHGAYTQDANMTKGCAMSIPSSSRTSNRSTVHENARYNQDSGELPHMALPRRQLRRELAERRLKKVNTNFQHLSFASNLSNSAAESSSFTARTSTPGSSSSTPTSTKPADGFSSKIDFGGFPDNFGVRSSFLRRNLPSSQRASAAASSFRALAPSDSEFAIPHALSRDQVSQRRKRKPDWHGVQNQFDTLPSFLQSANIHQQMSKSAAGSVEHDYLQKQLEDLNSKPFVAPPRPSKFPRIYARNGRDTSAEAPTRVAQSATVVSAPPQVTNQGAQASDIEQGYAVGDRIIVLRTSGQWEAGWMVQSVSADSSVMCTKDVLSKLIPMNEVPNYLRPENPPTFCQGDSVSSKIDGSQGKVVSLSRTGVVCVYWVSTRERKRFSPEALARSLVNLSRRLALPAPNSKPSNLGQCQPSHATVRVQEHPSWSSSSLFAQERPRPHIEIASKELAQPMVYANARKRFEQVNSAFVLSALQRGQAPNGPPSLPLDSSRRAHAGPGSAMSAPLQGAYVSHGYGPAAGDLAQFGPRAGLDARAAVLGRTDAVRSSYTPSPGRHAPAPPRAGLPSRLARRRAPVLHSLDAEALQQPPLAYHDRVRQSVASALLARRVSASKPENAAAGHRLLPEEERASQKRQQAVIEGPKDTPTKLQKASKRSPNRVDRKKSTRDIIDMTQSESPSPPSSDGSDSSDEEPNQFCCPISCEIMKDPVVAEDGQSYERAALRMWFASGKNTSPLTQAKISPSVMIPNHALKSMIFEWQTKRRQRKKLKANSQRQEK